MPQQAFYCTNCKTTGVDKWNEEQNIIVDYCCLCQEETLHSKNIPSKLPNAAKLLEEALKR